MSPVQLLEHLVGLQAQEANSWYGGFWSRIEGFDPFDVSRLLEERKIVRIALMRSTIHLVTADDALALRPLLQPAVEKPMTGESRRRLKEQHAEEIIAAGRAAFADGPLTTKELGAVLSARWPEPGPNDLAMAVRVWVPLVQTTPRGLWQQSGAAKHVPLDSWVGRSGGPAASVDDLVLRYLGAFGPATPADAQAWCGLSRLREVFERLRTQLVTFRAEDGRELFDLPDAPRPAADTPAPVRFLYDYDNLMLGHSDRSRFGTPELRAKLLDVIAMYVYGTVLVDGFVAAIWRIERDRDNSSALLIVRLVQKLASSDLEAVESEGRALLEFWAADAHERKISFRGLED